MYSYMLIYTQHCSAEYSKAIFDSHLDKEPRYSIPSAPKHAPQEVKNLLPSIREVHVHHHGDQTAIAIEGTNLWFCHEVSLLGQKQNIPPSITSGSSIHINIAKKLKLGDDASGRQSISSVIFTPFSSKSIKQDSIPLFVKVIIILFLCNQRNKGWGYGPPLFKVPLNSVSRICHNF